MRRELLLELEEQPMPADERVDPEEYVAILQEAVAARNGWRRILIQCAPRRLALAVDFRSTTDARSDA